MLIKLINTVFFYVFKIFPVKKNYICFESEGDFSDNSYALYYYLLKNGYLNQRKFFWFVDDTSREINQKDIYILPKKMNKLCIKRMYVLSVSKYIFYDHNNLFYSLKKKKNQVLVYLMHGCTYKLRKGTTKSCPKTLPDEAYILSKEFLVPMSLWSNLPVESFIDIGYPRLDYFYMSPSDNLISFAKRNNFDKYKKIFIWMPTYRKSNSMGISEASYNSLTDLPILKSKKEFDTFNNYLSDNRVYLIIKIHHLQQEMPFYENKYTNILFLNDEMLVANSIQLYELVSITDCLLTDYSSIYNDYMLLDKPMIFMLDDIDMYSQSRGFSIENITETMKGSHVYNYQDLITSMDSVINGIDLFKDERERWKYCCHTHVDGNASRRIVERLGIELYD